MVLDGARHNGVHQEMWQVPKIYSNKSPPSYQDGANEQCNTPNHKNEY